MGIGVLSLILPAPLCVQTIQGGGSDSQAIAITRVGSQPSGKTWPNTAVGRSSPRSGTTCKRRVWLWPYPSPARVESRKRRPSVSNLEAVPGFDHQNSATLKRELLTDPYFGLEGCREPRQPPGHRGREAQRLGAHPDARLLVLTAVLKTFRGPECGASSASPADDQHPQVLLVRVAGATTSEGGRL
jgi:hypothetical protein